MKWLFLALIALGIAYDWLATFLFARWIRAPILPNETTFQPVTFFRPIKKGVLELEEKLATFFAATLPGDQILLGIYEDDLVSQNAVQNVRAAFPERDASLILCRRHVAKNPKINKLIPLATRARHDFWIVLDSELLAFESFLPRFRSEWQRRGFPVLSAPYRFRKLTFASFPVLLTLLPGLAILRRFGRIRNALGAVFAVTREHVSQLGGWESLAEELAEDFQVGHRLSGLGVPVFFSWAIATLDHEPASARQILRQLHRISATYRLCQPWGFAGSILVLSPFWSLALLAATDVRLGLSCLVGSLISQAIALSWRARITDWSFSFGSLLWRLPIAVLLEMFFYFMAWLPLPIFWADEAWRICEIRERRTK